jgi:hypothetical protein
MKRLSAASRLLVLVFAGTCGFPAVAQESSVYKWVDSQGVPHFSDQPPADIAAEELAIRYRRTDRAAVQARLKAQSELDAATEVREGQELDAEATAKADRAKYLAERKATCKAARDRMAKYNDAQRLYKPGPNGERVYLTSEELDVERANADRAVEQFCSEE